MASDTETALRYLDHAVNADGTSPEVRFARAWLLYRAGRVQDSLPDLLTALEGAPQNVEVLAQLGLTYLTLDRPAEAEKVLRRALADAPEHSDVLLHLGRALVALDRSDEAQPYLAKFQQLRPAVNRGPRTEPGMIASATERRVHRLQQRWMERRVFGEWGRGQSGHEGGTARLNVRESGFNACELICTHILATSSFGCTWQVFYCR